MDTPHGEVFNSTHEVGPFTVQHRELGRISQQTLTESVAKRLKDNEIGERISQVSREKQAAEVEAVKGKPDDY